MSIRNRSKFVTFLAVVAVVASACGTDGAGDTTAVTDVTTAVTEPPATTSTLVSETTAGDTTVPSTGGADDFDAEAYFSGRTVRVVVTSSSGGNTDLFGRFIANRISEHIPGSPQLAVTNAGGLGGYGTVFEAPEEDLVIGVTSRSSALYGTAADVDATHVPAEIQVIGGIAGDSRAWTGFGDLVDAYTSLSDASADSEVRLKFAATVGGPEEIESGVLLYSWMCVNMDLPCDFISVAEDSSTDINLMVQRGEVNLQDGTMITMMREYLGDIEAGDASLLLEYAVPENQIPLPEGVEVDNIRDVLPESLHDEYERILPALASGDLGNMYWAGPGVPEGAIEALREAFAAVVGDGEAIAELNGIMVGGESPYEYTVFPLVGQEAQDAFDRSTSTFEENFDLISDLREEYWSAHWGG